MVDFEVHAIEAKKNMKGVVGYKLAARERAWIRGIVLKINRISRIARNLVASFEELISYVGDRINEVCDCRELWRVREELVKVLEYVRMWWKSQLSMRIRGRKYVDDECARVMDKNIKNLEDCCQEIDSAVGRVPINPIDEAYKSVDVYDDVAV